jgi:hypothetical protein
VYVLCFRRRQAASDEYKHEFKRLHNSLIASMDVDAFLNFNCILTSIAQCTTLNFQPKLASDRKIYFRNFSNPSNIYSPTSVQAEKTSYTSAVDGATILSEFVWRTSFESRLCSIFYCFLSYALKQHLDCDGCRIAV